MTGVSPESRHIRAPRGSELNCLGWQQEGALRMLMNNLDPEVAEHPEDLVVYGGTGKAARDWASFDAIVRTLKTLKDDVRSSSTTRRTSPRRSRSTATRSTAYAGCASRA
ncbi:hypothetical protein ACWCRC_38370, partial [Streptomyces sp. NPDC001940]